MTLIEFLNARLDEDEQAASAAIAVQEEIYPAPRFEVHYEWSRRTRHVSGGGGVEPVPGAPDPARVLREIAAKRAVVDLHVCQCSADCGDCDACSGAHHADPTPAPCDTLRALATIYSDHPDYQQEWAP